MNSPLQLPEIFDFARPPAPVTAAENNRKIAAQLAKGRSFCLEGTWGTAMAFYSWLKKHVAQQVPAIDYASSRRQREALGRLTSHLYLRIHNYHPDLKKAPGNVWLQEFFRGKQVFYMRFTDYLGMNGARQWFEKGIQFPGLKVRIHPFYGTYFPTRTEHLELFDQWLAQQPPMQSAMDIGTGCGVLTFYMLKHGIGHITATDINPNALYSLQQELDRNPAATGVQLKQTSFFDGIALPEPGLIVFNPPWLPMPSHTFIDKAMYYEPGFFETFFSEAFAVLSPKCAMVLLFSDFARVAGISAEHPVEHELNHGGRFILREKTERPLQQPSSGRKSWLQKIRSSEKAELWVLQKKT